MLEENEVRELLRARGVARPRDPGDLVGMYCVVVNGESVRGGRVVKWSGTRRQVAVAFEYNGCGDEYMPEWVSAVLFERGLAAVFYTRGEMSGTREALLDARAAAKPSAAKPSATKPSALDVFAATEGKP